MPDLNTEQVRAQLASLGLSPVDDEDLDEISHRINALREALAGIEPGDLDAQEPVTMFDQRGGPDEP
jgi:hypothetical protein